MSTVQQPIPSFVLLGPALPVCTHAHAMHHKTVANENLQLLLRDCITMYINYNIVKTGALCIVKINVRFI